MEKLSFKPGNMLYPLPVVLVGVADGRGRSNVLTIAWTGTVCSDPAMLSISVRKERFSHAMLLATGEFSVNLTTRDLVFATDLCGVKSGRDGDKWKAAGLTPAPGELISAPLVQESPVNIECKVTSVQELGSHDMFLAKVVAVHASADCLDEAGKFHLEKARPIVYSHGTYFALGEPLGQFGFSVAKRPAR